MAVATDHVYRAIKAGISSGDYSAGSHLGAAGLADQLGVSRTPVQEALRRLSAEGLVDFLANRGAYVTTWSRDDVEEVFALRTVLESHAAECSATRLTPDLIGRLERFAGRMEDVVSAGSRDLATMTALNGEFHSIIIMAAANSRLSAMISSVVEIALVTRTFRAYSDEDLSRSMTHHREIIAAFKARDAQWAGSVMRSHIRAAQHVFMGGTAQASD